MPAMSFLSDVPSTWEVLPDAFVRGISLVTIPNSGIAPLLQLCEALHSTQFEEPEVIRLRQMAQARYMLQFAASQSPHYRKTLAGLDIDTACASPEAWRTIPILTRSDLQRADPPIFPEYMPIGHQVASEVQTSGSTGQPVRVRKSAFSRLFFRALAIREQAWHQRDITKKLASIRANVKKESRENWSSAVSHIFRTGAYDCLPFVDITEQLAWLAKVQPHYLLTYPSNLLALLNAAAEKSLRLENLIEVRSIGETLSTDLRERCEDQWSVKVSDLYSSEEVGNIACQCPENGRYHLMEENLVVEVLRDDGTPCAPGEIGRIVVTDLHNFATPLIRYDIRDYAEVGEPCTCGRGLATLNRILGRHRNMLRTPEGEVRWPLTGFHNFDEVTPVRQYQFVQSERDLVEATLIVDEPLTPDQRAALEGIIRKALQWDHRLTVSDQCTPLAVGVNGKFEDFVSHV